MTKTQQARKLHEVLRRFNLVDISFTGLMGDAVWVSDRRKAYRLRDLSDQHLSNIIMKYINNDEGIPGCLGDELTRRKEARW